MRHPKLIMRLRVQNGRILASISSFLFVVLASVSFEASALPPILCYGPDPWLTGTTIARLPPPRHRSCDTPPASTPLADAAAGTPVLAGRSCEELTTPA